MKIEQLHKLYSEHFLVDTDTRKIRKNTIFFALKGENFNGNKFALESLKIGAKKAIVDEKEYATKDTIILVDNVLETLQQLASYHRKTLNIPIIGLTGSNGKTTTKELINAILETQYRTTATTGNLNNHIGVPLTLLSMTPQTEFGKVLLSTLFRITSATAKIPFTLSPRASKYSASVMQCQSRPPFAAGSRSTKA